jgi:hypothetical protein
VVVPLSALPAVRLADGRAHAEDGLVPKPWMQRIGLAWLCRLTRERRRLAHRYRAPLICHPGVHCAGTPISEHAKIPDAARNPTSSEPASA